MRTKQLIYCIICSVLLAMNMNEAKSQDSDFVSLEIIINDVANTNGEINLSLIDENEAMVKSAVIPANNEGHMIRFTDLKKGKYAVKMFHDENSNKDLDKNGYGMPTEGYGFSNDPNSQFGPPALKKLLFDVQEDTQKSVKMMYYW